MSSGRGDASREGSWLGVREYGMVDGVGEKSLECSQRFDLATTAGEASIEMGAGIKMAVHLGDGDVVNRCVRLSVPGS